MAGLSALFAVVLFSLTVPMSQMAMAVFSPEFITFFRAGGAGLGSVCLMLLFKWKLPNKQHCVKLVIAGMAVTLLFPYFLVKALSAFSPQNMGVMLAGIPLITALIAVFIFTEKTNKVFWFSLLSGTGLLLHFSYSQSQNGFNVYAVLMLLMAGLGYSLGGQVAKSIGGFKTICWMCIFYLPVSIFGLGYEAIENTHGFSFVYLKELLALLYLALLSQWIGFHFWYGAMAKIGIARAGQVQLLQPFFTLFFCVPLLGNSLESHHLFYAGLITLTVVLTMKYRV
jgi:drug/metabolite transporter (DMT)-like permease